MRTYFLISLLSVITAVLCRPQEQHGSNLRPPEPPLRTHFRTDAEYRGSKGPMLRDTMDILAKQLINTNSTDFTLDTRTPPRIKLQQKQSMKNKQPKPEIKTEEVSHPGVAVPVDVDTLMEVTTPKRETTTTPVSSTSTEGGLSTWVLLSGNSHSTKSALRKVVSSKPTTSKSTYVQSTTPKFVTMGDKIQKTTSKPRVTTKKPTTTTVMTSVEPKLPNKVMTKVKASVLNSAINNKNKTTVPPSTSTVTTPSTTTTVTTTTTPTTVTKKVDAPKPTEETKEDNSLKPEAKIVEIELPESKMPNKRPTKRPPVANNNKRKKNKNRRRKPETNTKTNGTKITKEKPIGTQIYNYLSREVMPTVGVGLVGLVVTAGLASYFLFPFSGLRRNFEGATDRRDEYYYDNYMSDGELEQDVIGKMIEGGYEYPNQLANYVHQPYDRYNDYDKIISEKQKEAEYKVVDDRKSKQKYVVGNIPNNYNLNNFDPTPAAVPEHGPRSLRIRRNAPKEEDNEITIHRTKYTKYKETLKQKADAINENLNKGETTTERITTIPSSSTTKTPDKREPNNFFTFFRNLFEMKVRLGLDFLANTTETVSKYLRGVQSRVENVIQAHHNRYNSNKRPTHNRPSSTTQSTEETTSSTDNTPNDNTTKKL